MTRATTMAFIGDLIFDKRCSAAAEAGRPQDVWGDVLPLLRGVDAVIANLEVPLTNWPHRWQRTFKPVRLRAVPAAVNLLSAANIAFVNFANNERLDELGFTPFGKVIKGMDVLEMLNSEFGEEASQQQGRIQKEGNKFLDKNFPGLDSIVTATIVPAKE